ncbi:MAG: DASS family sodium-coupled anion symporter, partial [Phycisphaerae bacterium]|nr:DASS family sodium-coupled anion symporter [Phycisphaerae bacterium]
LGAAGATTAGLMAWMAIWWVTEAIDVAATALLPLAVLPLATTAAHGSASAAMSAAATPYAHPLIALFMGGFLLALAMERWGLHRRIALTTLAFVGTRPLSVVAGFMAVTAVMSMWVSNTATTVMMLPIALSVTGLLSEGTRRRRNLALCLMLGVAYAASVGGIGTLIGTPPNLLLAGFARDQLDRDIGFAEWLLVGVPLVVVFVPIIWFMLTRVIYPLDNRPIEGGATLIRSELAALGRMKPGEWATFIVFMLTAAAWITRPLLARVTIGGTHPFAGLTDAGIAVIAALVLFVIPTDLRRRTFVLNWAWARRLPWGILILFGGGLSLAAAVSTHGVADFIGRQAVVLAPLPAWLIVMAIAAGVIFLTELTSNTATTATLLPILAGIAPALGLPPILLIAPAAIAASCAFMMPIATPPNAIVFGSGHVTIPQMCRAGLWLNGIGIVLVTALAYTVILPRFG